MAAPPVALSGVEFSFGEDALRRPVLRDLGLTVAAGEVVLLTGPSGSGKTTLLTLIGALRAMQQGSCVVLGQELMGASESARVALRRRIGFIFQNHNLLAFLTAAQNVAMSLELHPNFGDEAARIAEAERMLAALRVFIDHDVPVVGLEPSCLFTLRDEFLVQRLGDDANRLAALAMTFEQFLAGELDAGRLTLPLGPLQAGRALLHGHCHQKAFDAVRPIETLLARIPGLTVELIESSCCGMAGAFGYEAEHFEVSMQMGELSLLPAVRGAAAETMIIADGTSCRQQIRDGAQRDALHVARVLDLALAPA